MFAGSFPKYVMKAFLNKSAYRKQSQASDHLLFYLVTIRLWIPSKHCLQVT